MSKGMLRKEEKNGLSTIYTRIEEAMKGTPYKTMAELDRAIAEDRGESPGQPFYTKLSKDRKTKGEKFTNITIENLYVIAEKLNVTTDYLLGYQRRVRKDEVKFSKLQYLGLSEAALKKLFETNSNAINYEPSKIRSGSRYYRNPYNKALDALNWIVEHININEDEQNNDNYDFLTTIYHLVMLNFPDYKGAIIEAVLNGAQIDSYKEWDEYAKLLFNERDPMIYETKDITEYKKEEIKQELDQARINVVQNSNCRKHDRQVMENIKNGVIAVNDPVTYDDVRISLADPQDIFKKHLFEIVQEWNKEFLPIYQRKQEQQKADYEEWYESVKDKTWIEEAEIKYEEQKEDDEYVPDELLFRRSWLANLSEEQMKLYMLLEYFEGTNFQLLRVEDDGEIFISNLSEFSVETIETFINQAKDDGVGISVKDGKIYYSSEDAQSTRERNEKLFFRYNLPYHLAKLLKDNEAVTLTTDAVYNPDCIYANYSDEDVTKIYDEAKIRGYSWKINGYHICIIKAKK